MAELKEYYLINTSFSRKFNIWTNDWITLFHCCLNAKVKFFCHTKIVIFNITLKHIKFLYLQIKKTHLIIIYRFFKSNFYFCFDIARQKKEKCYRYIYSKFYICLIKKSYWTEIHHLSFFKSVFIILKFQRSLQHFSDLSHFHLKFLYITVSLILYMKIYIFVIHLIRRQYAYHKYSALCLLRIFIEYFKRINWRVNL